MKLNQRLLIIDLISSPGRSPGRAIILQYPRRRRWRRWRWRRRRR